MSILVLYPLYLKLHVRWRRSTTRIILEYTLLFTNHI
ncbi:hypothetical protein YPPY54_1050, partial [Yersinia pestis PY-54]